MAIKLEFGDGTEPDTWRTIFSSLQGWVMKIRATVDIGRPFVGDVMFIDIVDPDDGTGEAMFEFARWNDSIGKPDEEVFHVKLDDLFSIYIY